MIAMRVMKPAIHQVVDMIAVWDGLMPAVWTMNMVGLVPCVTKFWGATSRATRSVPPSATTGQEDDAAGSAAS